MKFKDFLSFKKGDEQREPALPKLPNKLSKPRTNKNSNLNLSSTKSNLNLLNVKSAPASRRNSIIANNEYATQNRNSTLPSEAGDIMEKKDAPKQKRRLSLFRSRSEKAKEKLPELEFGISTRVVEPSPVDHSSQKWSREPSTRRRGYSFMTEPTEDIPQPDLTEDMHALRTRLTFHQAQAAQYEQQLNRLSLVAEMPSPQLEPKELSRRNSKYEPSEDGTQTTYGGSRRGSDAEKYGPIRRRSLLQHGIATRLAFPESDSRRSLPSQSYAPESLQTQYSSPTNTEYFPPAGLVMFEPSSAFSTPGSRTETPTDLDYRQIGAFKLGSLRITNGVASPTPSRDSRAQSLGAEEIYIKQEQAPKSVEIEQRHGLTHRSQTLSVPAEARKVAPWVVRSESPLRQSLDTEYEPLSINIPDPSFALFDFQSTESMFKSTHSPTKSLDLALAYQQEIASSPFSFDNSPLPSPRFDSTSKNTATKDELFELESNTPNLEATRRMPHSLNFGYEGCPAPKPKDSHESDIKPLAKADSGYSSIVSSRSFKKEGPKVPLKDPPTPIRETFVRVPSSTYSVNSSIGPESSPHNQKSGPALPVEEAVERPSEPIKRASLMPFKSFSYEKSAPLQSPSLLRQSVEQATVQAQSHLQIPKTQSKRKNLPVIANSAREMRENSPVDSEESVSSSGSSSIWQRKKLSKRVSRPSSFQPQSEPVYTIQAFRSPSEVFRIPVPPLDIRRQLDERVESFPVVAFANTNSGMTPLRLTASKETLGTIFSVGSAEVTDEVNFARLQGALPAVPTEPTIEEDALQSPIWKPHPGFNKRHTYQAPSPTTAPAQDWTPRSSFDLTQAREPSRDRSSLLMSNEVAVPTPQASPESIQTQTPRKSFQKTTSRNPSPGPVPAPPSRDSAKTPSHNLSPFRAPLRNRRKSFQNPASRDPSLASTHRALSSDFETHITSFDAISSSLGKSPYELVLDTMPQNTADKDRSRFTSARYEADVAQRFTNLRSVSQESQASTIVRPQRSYESIRNSNPWSGDNKSASRLSVTGPPSAHSNGRRPYSFQQALSRVTLPSYRGYGNDTFASGEEDQVPYLPKPKATPPTSMSTQRNGLPTKKSLSSLPVSLQIIPNHTLPQPTASFPPNGEVVGPWKNTAGAWAERRNSADQALSAQKSQSAIQTPPRSQPQTQGSRGRRSINMRSHGEGLYRASSVAPSIENERPRILHCEKSFDNSQQRQGSWNSNNTYDNGQQYYEQPEYNHTYGSVDYSHSQGSKENWTQYGEGEGEYHDTEQGLGYEQQGLQEGIHQRKMSTSEMLGLGSFEGVMDDEFSNRWGRCGRTTGKMVY